MNLKVLSAVSIFSFILVSGCSQEYSLMQETQKTAPTLATPAPATPTPVPTTPTATPVPTVTPSPTVVCDPFGGTGDNKHGLKGNLYYFNDNEVADKSNLPYSSVSDFFTKGHNANVDLYMSYLYTPTRAFDSGFATTDGTILQKSDGTKLFEYFGIDMKGGIQLATGATKKKYQFAILSDDGAKLYITTKSATGAETKNLVVDADGDHASLFRVARMPIELSSTDRLKIEIQYYQGPRYHISLILLWREWNDSNWLDPKDGVSGNDTFFNSSVSPSSAQPAWTDIMTRWSVVPGEVLYIEGGGTNPCNK